MFATGSRAVLQLPTQLLPVGKGFRQQPPRRCQESILPGNAFPPVVGDGVQAVEGAGELPRHCCYRIGVVARLAASSTAPRKSPVRATDQMAASSV